MGAYYNTAEGKFIDFIYKPDREMMLKLAKQEVATQGLKNKLVTLGDQFNDVKLDIFEEYEEEANKIMKPLGENINTLISQVVKDPENVNLNSQLKSSIKELTKQLQSGDLSIMQNQYATWKSQNKMYEDMISKAKDEDERTGIKNQQNIYNAWVKEQVSKGYDPNFKIPGGAGYVNAQKILKETVGIAGLKYDYTRPGIMTGWHYQDPKTKQLIKVDLNTMDVDQERRVVKDKATGQVYGAAITYDPSIDYLTGTEYQTFKHNLQGYYQSTIHQVALANLLNNDAFLSMERQKYRLGDAGGTKEGGVKETEQEYLYRKANENARIYASQYAETTVDNITADTHSDAGALENLKSRNRIKEADLEKERNAIPEIIEIADIITPRYTQKEVVDIQNEFTNLMGRQNLTEAEQIRFNELQQTFGDAFTDERLNEIMLASGYYNQGDLDKLKKEEKVQWLVKTMDGIAEAHAAGATKASGFWATVWNKDREVKITQEQRAIYLKLEAELQKKGTVISDEIANLAKSIVFTENAIVLNGKKTDNKNPTFNDLNSQFINQIMAKSGGVVFSSPVHVFNKDGKLRTQDDSPTEMQLAQDTPDQLLSFIKSQDEDVKDLNDAVDKGWITLKFTIQGPNVQIVITPLRKELNGIGKIIDEGVFYDSERTKGIQVGKSFSVVKTGISNDKKGWKEQVKNNYGDNRDVQEIVNNADGTYNLIKRKFQILEANQDRIYHPKGYRFNIKAEEFAEYQAKNLKSYVKTPQNYEYRIKASDKGGIDVDIMIMGTENIYESIGNFRNLELARAALSDYVLN